MSDFVNQIMGDIIAKPHQMIASKPVHKYRVMVKHTAGAKLPRGDWLFNVAVFRDDPPMKVGGIMIMGRRSIDPRKTINNVQWTDLRDVLLSVEAAAILEAI